MAKSKTMCLGCRDDYYNHSEKDGCWMFANAEIVTRVRVGTWEPPPYAKERAVKCLSCFTAQGYSFLPLDDCRVKTTKQIARENGLQSYEEDTMK